MKKYFKTDEWNIILEGFNPDDNRVYESAMSIGNGRMGIRGNFEEDYSGDTLKGTYVAGVYYPDKTRVGWWKNGYPEYFAKVLNSTNFIGIRVAIDRESLDLAKCQVKDFKQVLNMKHGYLVRSFIAIDEKGRETKVEAKRFLSIVDTDIAAISYSVTPVGYDADITFEPYLDGDVSNEDSNYDEKFWVEVEKKAEDYRGHLVMKTKKLDFHVIAAMKFDILKGGAAGVLHVEHTGREKYVGNRVTLSAGANETVTLNKYIAVTSSRYHEKSELVNAAAKALDNAYEKGFDTLLEEHSRAWEELWRESDIVIEGDADAQQGIRFNIFHLNQTYTGEDPRLNIGPKGFTGEKYGGSTYWDTEAYCLPFYLSTREQGIARNLLIYRYNHLEKAKENARKLGLKGAFYPMVTMNGEECHNEWEITFEEIHRNAAISYAIFNYVKYTEDEGYLFDYGFEVLAEISRFWASRSNYNPIKDKYMILGVTGPNEYENNVNNNWYTNTMAAWNLEYALEVAELIRQGNPARYEELIGKMGITEEEMKKWKDIVAKMYYPYVESLGVFEQQDGFMDKEQIMVRDLPSEDLPINQNWSWDRILRSCFIKQADVLQGLYFLNDRFDLDTKKRNFDFYEPRTVHESSLSPCVHSIIAGEIGYEDKAHELYLRTARLDIDNYNNDTEDGLHITSMAGTWMSIVHGFGGMRIKEGKLCLNPFIPKAWKKYSFKLSFRGHLLRVTVDRDGVLIEQENGDSLSMKVFEREYTIPAAGRVEMEL